MPDIRHALVIGAPAETVFDAVTRQEGLSAWWTPDVATRAEVEDIARFRFGPDYFKEMRIVDLTRPSRVEWRCLAGAEEWIGTAITFDIESGDRDTLLASHPEAGDQLDQLAPQATQTLLTMSHDDWRGYTPMFAECSYTWGQFLRGLKRLCETGRGRPWPHQHQAAR